MRQFSACYPLLLCSCMLFLAGCTAVVAPVSSQSVESPLNADHPNATDLESLDIELLGVIVIPNNTVAFDTLVGGLSAIAYDQEADTYYFLSDDRGMTGPVRIYQATVDISAGGFDDNRLDDGDLTWTGMISLLDETEAPFAQGLLDPEGLVYTEGAFYVSTEGDVDIANPIAPAILEFNAAGELIAQLPLPEKFLPQAGNNRGVRDNQGFESLTLTPDGRYLLSGVENALLQDGPAATVDEGSLSRLLKIDLTGESPPTEFVYPVDPIPVASDSASVEADNGLVDLIALDNEGTLLAMERSYAPGVGNTVRLYLAKMQGAMDVSDIITLALDEGVTGVEIDPPVGKELLVDFGELGNALGVAPDNLEGMALGPQLSDGRQLLLVVSDNNFNPSQRTQLWALALPLETLPTLHTP
jgi:hypothetical protein